MSNTLYLDETLTGFEREIAIESAKMDISMQKLDALYEAVDANLQANYKEAELKVYAENGTYDDLAMLYMEAENDAAEKKGGIFSSLFNAIVNFCSSIINGIRNIFKSKKSKAVPQDTVLEVEAEDNKKLEMSGKIIDGATGFLHGIKSTTKDGCEDLVKFVKDNIGFVVVSGAAATGAVAGTTHLITKKVTKSNFKKKLIEQLKVTKSDFEKKLNERLDALDKTKQAARVAQLAIKAGQFIFKDDSEDDNKPNTQPAAETPKDADKNPADTATTGQSASTTKTSGNTNGKKFSKILDAVKTALSWIGKGIKAIGKFLSDIWRKYIGKLFSKNTSTQESNSNGTPSNQPAADEADESEAKPEETKTESTIDFLLDLI